MAKAGDQTQLDGIFRAGEYDRYGGRRRLGRDRGGEASARHDDGNLALDELVGELRKQVQFALGPAIFDRQVLAVDVAAFLESAAEGFDEMRAFVRRSAIEEADEGDRALRAADDRPRQCCAADEELPPPHASSPRVRRLYAGKSKAGPRS